MVCNRTIAKWLLCLAVVAIASIFLAAIWERSPGMWWLVPEAVMTFAMDLAAPTSQEEEANVEFAVFCGVAFVLLSALSLGIFFGWRTLIAPRACTRGRSAN